MVCGRFRGQHGGAGFGQAVMTGSLADRHGQVPAAVALLGRVLGGGLAGVWLHGSAVAGGLRGQSDLDLLAVVRDGLDAAQRRGLLDGLMALSAPHPAVPGGPRCLEVLVFRQADLAAPCPARAEFVYGEWLRNGFERGATAAPTVDPDLTLVLAQARAVAVPLLGPPLAEVLPVIEGACIRQAMRALLPGLAGALDGDVRNVLLTLARVWFTAGTGGFATKDAAAGWALPRLDAADAAVLDLARQGYVGAVRDDWHGRMEAARHLAATMQDRIGRLL